MFYSYNQRKFKNLLIQINFLLEDIMGSGRDVMAPFNIRFYPVLRKMDGGEKKCSNKFQIVQEQNSKHFIFFATYE
jgi:hypothetical protein